MHFVRNMGYYITRLYAATSYTGVKALMNDYAMHFLRMQICNNKPLDEEQCGEVTSYHKGIGFQDWKDISPEDASNTLGLKQVAKLCLHSSCGKAAQISRLPTSNLFVHYFEFINGMIRGDALQIQDTIRSRILSHPIMSLIKYS